MHFTILNKAVIASLVGVASHRLIFIKGEWHMQAPKILAFYVVVGLLLLLVEGCRISSVWSPLAFQNSVYIISAYLGGLFSSILVYRLWFHRLRNFPGPYGARISKLWHVGKCVANGSQNYLLLDQLYHKYGDIVRTGPSEVTVFSPDILSLLDGPGNSCHKAVWYDFLLPEVAVNTTRSKPMHDQRRRIWDRGFTTKALATYHNQTIRYARVMESQVDHAASRNEPIDIGTRFYWFSFDVMGQFAFARSFDMLEKETWHFVILMLRRAMSLLGPFSPVPWLAQIAFKYIPNVWVVRDWNSMMAWCKQRMMDRIEMQPEETDVSSYLIDASLKNNSIEKDRPWLNGDSIAIIIAGSDTVAPTLVFLFYELAKNPEETEKLYQEIQSVDARDERTLQGLPHLNGLINETLRLHPPVPSGGYRETSEQGLMVGNTYIPGGTTIVAPRYTIGRREDCFVKAESFIPERWYSKPELIKDKRAFAPFSQGRYSCVGKNLALAEIRHVTALLVQKYRFTFRAGDNGSAVENDMKDQFTAAPGGLNLVFDYREK